MAGDRSNSRNKFVELMTEAVVLLPQDLKALLRLVEDQDIDDESRVAIAGSILHVLSAGNAIPGVRGILQHVGDVLVIRLVLARVREKSSDDVLAKHVRDSPELLEPLDEQLETAREFLGDNIEVLQSVANSVSSLNHKGHSAKKCVFDTESENWLYDEVHEAIVEQFEFDQEDVDREMKNVDRIIAPLASRVTR